MESGLLNGAMSKLVADILPPNEATEAMHISEVKAETLEGTRDVKVGFLNASLDLESMSVHVLPIRISSYLFLHFAWQGAEVSLFR